MLLPIHKQRLGGWNPPPRFMQTGGRTASPSSLRFPATSHAIKSFKTDVALQLLEFESRGDLTEFSKIKTPQIIDL